MKTLLTPHRTARFVWAALAIVALSLAPLQVTAQTLEIGIQCSPSTIVLRAIRSGDCLTVHADIPYSLVVKGSVELQAPYGLLKPYSTFADDCGNLVAKFTMSELKPLLGVGVNSLDLSGEAVAPQDPEVIVGFTGTDSVRVKK
jgi:hypothetical protein